ncbi:MAG: hypothetical protein ACLTBC_03705 [Pilosibacter sp.]
MPLYADAEKEVLFLYRYEQLERHFEKPGSARSFYAAVAMRVLMASVLVRLRRRYQLYAGISKEFPH